MGMSMGLFFHLLNYHGFDWWELLPQDRERLFVVREEGFFPCSLFLLFVLVQWKGGVS